MLWSQEKQILHKAYMLRVDYDISPLSIDEFSNFKAQALKFEKPSRVKKYCKTLVAEGESK